MVVGTLVGKIILSTFEFISDISSFQLALGTGSAMPIMMWLFQSVINSLVSIGKDNATTSADWYSSMQIIGSFIFHYSVCFSYTSPLSTGDPYETIEGIIKWYATIGASSIVLHWIAYAFWVKHSVCFLLTIMK